MKAIEGLLAAFPGAADPSPFPVSEIHVEGVLTRSMGIPAGQVLVGRRHRHPHVTLIQMGRVRVLSVDGDETFVAPAAFVSSPGAKRVWYAFEDTIVTTIHQIHGIDPTDRLSVEAHLLED